MQLPREIKSPRLRLRAPQWSDVGFLAELYGDPGVVRYLSFKPITRIELIQTFLQKAIASWGRGKGSFDGSNSYLYVVEEQKGKEVGTLGVRLETYGYELSYALLKSSWGRGYMPEAVGAVSEWLLSNGAWRVFATCHVDNVGSQRTLEKAGFEREGRLRRYFVFPNLGAEPADGYLYARVRE